MMVLHSLVFVVLLLVNGSLPVATAPVAFPKSHALLTSPLFNTPLPPPPLALESIFSKPSRLPEHQLPNLPGHVNQRRGDCSDDTPSSELSLIFNTTTTALCAANTESTPLTTSPTLTSATHTTTTAHPPPSNNAPQETTSTMCTASSPSSPPRPPQPSVHSITMLETVLHTTTVLPAVTVTGLQTLTSVVVVPLAGEETGSVMATAVVTKSCGSWV